MRELGDLFSGQHMAERNAIMKALRAGGPSLPIACHERPMVEVPVADFRNVGGDVISGLQCGFKTPTGGHNRKRDEVTSPDGKHTYDGACGFVAASKKRMDGYVGTQMERHTNAIFEHSIPLVYAGQAWKPHRDLEEAQTRGAMILKHGAAFDLSAGARRG